jgi:hypothetical protein
MIMTLIQAYGYGEFGAYAVMSGQSIRLGLTWAGDPGPVYLTTQCGTVPSTLVRAEPTREIGAREGYAYITTEWITVTATSSWEWLTDVGVSYLSTYQADASRIIEDHGDIVEPPRFHVIAQNGRVVGWVRVRPPVPGHPDPVIAPAIKGHTLHLDIEIEAEGDDAQATADRLSRAITG